PTLYCYGIDPDVSVYLNQTFRRFNFQLTNQHKRHDRRAHVADRMDLHDLLDSLLGGGVGLRLVQTARASGSWGGQRLSLAHYVTGMGPMDGATAAEERSCCLSSVLSGLRRRAAHARRWPSAVMVAACKRPRRRSVCKTPLRISSRCSRKGR